MNLPNIQWIRDGLESRFKDSGKEGEPVFLLTGIVQR
jgi:hypothetical protein